MVCTDILVSAGPRAHDFGQLFLRFDLILAIEHVGRYQALGNFAQGEHRGLVGLGLHQGRSAAGGKLTGALAGDHHQFKAVIDRGETVFDSNTCHE